MSGRNIVIILAASLIIANGGYYAYNGSQGWWGSATMRERRSIRLEIVIDGGFAYIPEGRNKLNIAYLKKWEYNGSHDSSPETDESTVFCSVPQMGTKLRVVTGDVAVPGPTIKEFDVDGTVITFPALQSSSAPLSPTRQARTASPFKPAHPDVDADWADLRFISSLRAEHGARLNPRWRSRANGFMVVRGGTITAQKAGRYQDDTFEFRKSPVITTAAATLAPMQVMGMNFEQSLTDRTLYSVDIRGRQVEINLETWDGTEKVVVKPEGASPIVRLMLLGEHDEMSVPPGPGEELKEHCTFYQLFDPVPQPASWFRPYRKPGPASTPPQAMPTTPGFFCPGDWF